MRDCSSTVNQHKPSLFKLLVGVFFPGITHRLSWLLFCRYSLQPTLVTGVAFSHFYSSGMGRRGRWDSVHLSCFTLLFGLGLQHMRSRPWQVSSSPSLLIPLETSSDTGRCVPALILNPVKLMVKMNSLTGPLEE